MWGQGGAWDCFPLGSGRAGEVPRGSGELRVKFPGDSSSSRSADGAEGLARVPEVRGCHRCPLLSQSGQRGFLLPDNLGTIWEQFGNNLGTILWPLKARPDLRNSRAGFFKSKGRRERWEFHHLWSSRASPGLISAAFPEPLSDQDPDVITSNRLSWCHVTSRNSWAAPGSGCSRHGATSSLNNPSAAQGWKILEFSPLPRNSRFPLGPALLG
ncbi:hypothetical protein DV515_00016231 [Chloebia gouldiae]|uniref:Uncharacterized protein n=1 Tax=Chloebia gouldiae TaxID=44316 RepID=A0A3L8RT17_CHLGU|nr:hypothetical protein DV515_00016231 [Chloebia gouldiae]